MTAARQLVRIGLVGCGRFGASHARIWGDVADASLCAVFDPIEDRARAVAAEIGAVSASSLDDLLAAVDAVDVVTPPSHHAEVVRRCLQAGRHVLAEKPLGTRASEARDLATLAEARDQILMVGYLERFHPGIGAALEALPKPRRIETLRINRAPPGDVGIGIVHDLMSHDIELATRWIGTPVAKITANAQRNAAGFIDEVAAELRFDDGRVASLIASWRGSMRRREIAAFADGCRQRIDLLDPSHRVDLLRNELANFIAAIHGHSAPAVTAVDAARTLSVAQMIVDALHVTEEAQCN
ncbi:MAG TPA: Gfo/Idh/MocA family oxidoreductase [Dongiaceae bacterium]|nr:Gfo/Idh/MocA family oxidoreductase [Dongiaceae bacterium]